MEYQKIYRSTTNKVIAGVAGGLGEFFAVDPVIIRIVFVVLTLMGGGGLLIYIILWIIVPYKIDTGFNFTNQSSETQHEDKKAESEIKDKDFHHDDQYDGDKSKHMPSRSSIFAGIILITLGILFLMDKFIPDIDFSKLWPIILIVIGILLLGGSFGIKSKN
jgi:phage shock protein C